MLNEFRFLVGRQPFHIVLYPTSRCNARCPHCYNYARQALAHPAGELTVAEIERLTSKLGHVKVLTISGGEPFLRDDLAGIVRAFVRENGLQYLSVHTNGFLTERVVRTIGDILRDRRDLQVIVCLSVDGIGEAHDRIRGVPGGFDRLLATVSGLKQLQEAHPSLHLITTTMYSRSTRATFRQTVRYVRETLGLRPSVSFIRGETAEPGEREIEAGDYRTFLAEEPPSHDHTVGRFSPLAVKEALEACMGDVVIGNYREGRQTVPCQAGRRSVVIFENGDVYPCELYREPFGNLRESGYDLAALLGSDRGKAIRRAIAHDRSCSCTWENIIPINLLYDLRSYPRIIRAWWKLFGRRTGLRSARKAT